MSPGPRQLPPSTWLVTNRPHKTVKNSSQRVQRFGSINMSRYFTGDILKRILSNENCCILYQIPLNSVHKGPTDNKTIRWSLRAHWVTSHCLNQWFQMPSLDHSELTGMRNDSWCLLKCLHEIAPNVYPLRDVAICGYMKYIPIFYQFLTPRWRRWLEDKDPCLYGYW